MADANFDDFPMGAAAPVAPAPTAGQEPKTSVAQNAQDASFDDLPQGAPDVSLLGAIGTGAALSAAPSAGGLVAAGPGAELGAAVGSTVGPIGTVVGGLAGGLGGYFLGSTAVGAAQDYLISKLPESWREEFEQKSQAAAAQHPYGFWIGGLAPVAITGSPIAAAEKLAPNATAFEKLMANPVTQRLLPAGIMGATEVSQEALQGQPIDPGKIALSTAFGAFFPGQNIIGRKLTSAFVPRVGVPADLPKPNDPTIAEAGDMKVAGPGITEQVYQGQEEMAPQAEMAAQASAQLEGETIGAAQPSNSDVATVARQMHS